MPVDFSHRIQAVVFDWAGTIVDHGCRAPARVFREIFERRGVPVTEAQAREPMGSAKRDHIAAICQMQDVRERWSTKHGGPPTEADIDAMYADFLPLQKEVLSAHSEAIPGAVETFAWLAKRGVKIGSTTGYTRELMEIVVPLAAQQGLEPGAVVCSDDVRRGRPAPWSLFEALHQLDAFPLRNVIKVDDTPVGIEAGRNAQCWTVAVIATGNEMGLSVDELTALSDAERDARLEPIREKFLGMGAHYAIKSVGDLPSVLEAIEKRLANGETP